MSIAKMKSRKHRDPLFAIVISVIVASILMVYPLSYTLSGWRPLFMLMVMLFWVLCQPTWCGIWFAFGTGIFMITGLAIVAHLLMIFFAQIVAGVQFSFARHWIPMLTSILVWPVLYYMLKKWRI